MTSLTTASGTLVTPVPLMSAHVAPPSVVCQTWPTPIAPIVTHASEVLGGLTLAGLTATPEIQASPGTRAVGLITGKPADTFVQVAPVPVALLLRHTAPK